MSGEKLNFPEAGAISPEGSPTAEDVPQATLQSSVTAIMRRMEKGSMITTRTRESDNRQQDPNQTSKPNITHACITAVRHTY